MSGTETPASVERIGLGIALALAGLFCMAVMDVCAKVLGADYAISQVVLLRNGIGAVLVLLFVAATSGGLASLKPRRPGLLLLRSCGNIGAAYLFFSGLRYLPLADAFAIAFAAPLFVTALSVPMLGEQVGLRRWAAVIFGFVGVVVVVQPGSASFQPAALLPLGAALSSALAILLGRRLTRDHTTPAIMFWPSLAAVAAMLLLMPLQWQTPALPDA